ncbi:hypothetical protein GCM10020254_31630 [Streptomyces goshikiensis]
MGVAAELAALLPGTGSGVYPEGATAGDVLAAAGGRRVVAVVRDAHRHPWMTKAVDALVEARPDTVVVEMGLPRAEPRGRCTSRRTGRRVCAAARRRRSSPGSPGRSRYGGRAGLPVRSPALPAYPRTA